MDNKKQYLLKIENESSIRWNPIQWLFGENVSAFWFQKLNSENVALDGARWGRRFRGLHAVARDRVFWFTAGWFHEATTLLWLQTKQ